MTGLAIESAGGDLVGKQSPGAPSDPSLTREAFGVTRNMRLPETIDLHAVRRDYAQSAARSAPKGGIGSTLKVHSLRLPFDRPRANGRRRINPARNRLSGVAP
ncbi:hypothetical protein [Sphingomonas alpina]|uniref:Uncharacterized protein n=1 Tax=Sphingomonas alpina TaxID=653931 RepID=A0A7H0LP06_9SPHN|nr:hypothetical protein [Sphingomonas alpina]QNQ11409.1 hypothetical protein H3Z74_09845 [Sphingomonas alpina]